MQFCHPKNSVTPYYKNLLDVIARELVLSRFAFIFSKYFILNTITYYMTFNEELK